MRILTDIIESGSNGVVYNAKGDPTASLFTLNSSATEIGSVSSLCEGTFNTNGTYTTLEEDDNFGSVTDNSTSGDWYDRGAVLGDEGTYGSNFEITNIVETNATAGVIDIHVPGSPASPLTTGSLLTNGLFISVQANDSGPGSETVKVVVTVRNNLTLATLDIDVEATATDAT